MTIQRPFDLAVVRPWRAIEQRLGRHDHAVAAEATLARLLLDEGPLERMEPVHGAEAFDGGDTTLCDRRHRRHARTYRLAVDQHRAGATLRQAAAKLRAVQLEIVPQHVQEWRVWLDRHRPGLTVHPQGEAGHRVLLVFSARVRDADVRGPEDKDHTRRCPLVPGDLDEGRKSPARRSGTLRADRTLTGRLRL